MQLLIHRQPSTRSSTPGSLFVDGLFECFTMEDVVREVPGQTVASWKVPGQTAIPSGTYEVIIDFSSRFQRNMPHILNVPGFLGVRIHPGIMSADTEGCILVGRKQNGPDRIQESKLAFEAFFLKLQRAIAQHEPVTITVGAMAADADSLFLNEEKVATLR